MRLGFALPLLAMLAGCSEQAGRDGPLEVSVVGGPPAMVDPDRRFLSPPAATLLTATAQGLVRFDGSGQIEPGAAIRWAVSDDGLYYTFRMDRGASITAPAAAARLRTAIGTNSRNPLKPVLGAVDEIVAVTPEVIELRLHAPRPNLLQLLAQPELALVRAGAGAGPFRIASRSKDVALLAPVAPEDEDLDEQARQRAQVRLRGERAALAVARFASGETRAVIGGTFLDLPVAQAAAPAERTLRFDPVVGLFGLVFTGTEGFAGSAENRRALAMAIDRSGIAAALGTPEWRPTATLVPSNLPDLATPARPDWIDTPLPDRRGIAAGAAARFAEAEGGSPVVRVALPEGPGSRRLFAALRRDWAAIGVIAERVAADAPADLRLIDAVAPADIASWYLRRFTCDQARVCSEAADTLLVAAREAPNLAERSARLAEADARLTEIVPFIPLAMPLRWSLVAPELDGFQPNARGVHPLNHLRRN